MSIPRVVVVCLASALVCVQARVVINEVLYHAPDGMEAAEFIELFNSGDEAVDLKSWRFTKGIGYQFGDKARMPPKGFLVVARSKEEFKKVYGFEPDGVFKEELKNKGEKLELSDAAGKKVDSVKYMDGAPWPLSADGETATLERISPGADSNDPHNWAPGPLGADSTKPGGTPGKENASYASEFPPVITGVQFSPRTPRPDQTVTVTAKIDKESDLDAVRLLYRVATAGSEKAEEAIPMSATGGKEFSATIPAQAENSIVRFRIEAVNRKGARRVEPPPFELQPAFSYFVHDKFNVGKIPWAFLVFVDEAEFKKEEERPKREGPGMPGNPDMFMARMRFESSTDIAPLWMDLCLTQKLTQAQIAQCREAVAQQIEQREENLRKFQPPGPSQPMKLAGELTAGFHEKSKQALGPVLDENQRRAFADWQAKKANLPPGPPNFTPEIALQRFCNIESAFLYIATRPNLSENAFEKLKAACASGIAEREKFVPRVRAAMQQQDEGEDLLNEILAMHSRITGKLTEALSDDDSRRAFTAWLEKNNPMQGRGGPGGSEGSKELESARGKNAFVFVSESGEAELFDYIKANDRSGGYKVHFAKNRPLRGMSAINLIFEYRERFVLAEPLAYEVYRRAGNAAELTDFVRLFVNGRPLAYHLLVEQPNRAFLKRNKIRDDGNLYKILWYERGLVRQHEKKTNLQGGHEDLERVVEALEKSRGEEQWAVIKTNFNVNQVATYFAVNTVLSHWDGFFNNYFTYHDIHGTGKWEMYPWDQDKTWGFYDALPDGEIFFDMPLTFGMEGDRPPGHPKDRPPPKGFAMGWWRPGGYFSKPLLANEQFRKIYLARTRDLLEHVYTEEVFFPIIDKLRDRLSGEVPLRAEMLKQKPAEARDQLERDLESLKKHLTKRREFLLAQEEIKTAGKFEAGKAP